MIRPIIPIYLDIIYGDIFVKGGIFIHIKGVFDRHRQIVLGLNGNRNLGRSLYPVIIQFVGNHIRSYLVFTGGIDNGIVLFYRCRSFGTLYAYGYGWGTTFIVLIIEEYIDGIRNCILVYKRKIILGRYDQSKVIGSKGGCSLIACIILGPGMYVPSVST